MFIAMALAVLLPAEGDASKLKVGDEAPAFSLPASTGKAITLAECKGKKKVVLAFVPGSCTGG